MNDGGNASNTSSFVTSTSGFNILVLYDPPIADSGNPGNNSLVGSFSLGNIIIIAVSMGTQPGVIHVTCIAITLIPKSNTSSGIVDSTYSTTRFLCCRSSIFSFAENILPYYCYLGGVWMMICDS